MSASMLREKMLLGFCWLVTSTLGAAFIINFWSAKDRSDAGWIRATIFAAVMGGVYWLGYRAYRNQRTSGIDTVTEPFSASYLPAIKAALIQQGVVLLLAALLLDGGRAFQICLAAALAFWATVGLIACRSWKTPTRVDLLAIRYGFLMMVVIASFVARAITSNLIALPHR